MLFMHKSARTCIRGLRFTQLTVVLIYSFFCFQQRHERESTLPICHSLLNRKCNLKVPRGLFHWSFFIVSLFYSSILLTVVNCWSKFRSLWCWFFFHPINCLLYPGNHANLYWMCSRQIKTDTVCEIVPRLWKT